MSASPVLHIYPDAAGRFPHLAGKRVHKLTEFTIGGLGGGMGSGAPSVVLLLDLPDGSFVFAETSLRLFLTAADALKAVYGDPRGEEPPP